MRPRITFVVMSAVHSAAAVDQLARSLAPHRVLVHHDFTQTPQFSLHAENASFVPDPKRTGWANWGFCEGIFHSLRHALELGDFDYLQLLTPCCLPIKPVGAFEAYVASSRFDANFDSIDLMEDRDALMSVGWRAFSPEGSFRHRVLRRLSRLYFRDESKAGWRHVAGVALRTGFAIDEHARMTRTARLSLGVLQAMSHSRVGRHPFGDRFRPHFGATWFGARPAVVAAMVDRFAQPAIRRYFSRLRIADEFLVPTLLRQTALFPGPGNHFVNTFDGARPLWFEEGDFDRLRLSPSFFARKFHDDPDNAIRKRVLEQLVAWGPRTAAIEFGPSPAFAVEKGVASAALDFMAEG